MASHNYAQTVYPYAWLPPVPLPEIPNSAPNFIQSGGTSQDVYAPKWLQTVLNAWAPIDQPIGLYLPPLDALNVGSGATNNLFGQARTTLLSEIVVSWQPPDPLPTLPFINKHFTPGVAPLPPPTPSNKVTPPHNVNLFGAIPVYIVPGGSVTGGINPSALVAKVVAQAGSAVILVVGPCNGGYVTNPPNAASQGLVSTENLYVDMVAPPGATDALAFGTTTLLSPGQSFTIPALAAGVTLWANATTGGHQITGEVW